MSKKRSHPRAVLSPEAQRDIRGILKWSEEEFGRRAALRYQALLVQALRDIKADPERAGAQKRPDLARGTWVYHLRFSRSRAGTSGGIVRSPRHFLVYRRRDPTILEIVRVLHDSRDLRRHLPEG